MLITPLDYLNYCKGRKIIVETKHSTITGVLKAFDLNINLNMITSNGDEFVKGESVTNIIITEPVKDIIPDQE